MRKWMLILLALCLTAVSCLAEENTHDFGDFTIAFPEGMTVDISDEIVADTPFFMLYQDDSQIRSLNGVWLPDVEDLNQADPETRAQERLDGIVEGYDQMGIAVENPRVVGAALGEQDGKPALMLIVSMNLDFSDAGSDLQTTQYVIQGIVSDAAFGTYIFTINTDDLETILPLMEVMDSIDWKD